MYGEDGKILFLRPLYTMLNDILDEISGRKIKYLFDLIFFNVAKLFIKIVILISIRETAYHLERVSSFHASPCINILSPLVSCSPFKRVSCIICDARFTKFSTMIKDRFE